MKFVHADVPRAPRNTVFAGRAVNGGCWVVAIALLGVYCGLRGYGELERRTAIALFLQPRGESAAAEATLVEPANLSPLEASSVSAQTL